MNISPWMKVVATPLGLVGFIIFMVFEYLAHKNSKPLWVQISIVVLAFVALVGGFGVHYLETSSGVPSKISPSASQQYNGVVQQKSSGDGAVNAVDVQGQINVNTKPDDPKTVSGSEGGKAPK